MKPEKNAVTHIIYSGLGGHTAVAFGLIEEFQKRSFRSTCLFFGIEPVLESSKHWCESKGVPYEYVKKTSIVRSIWEVLFRLLLLNPKSVICHSTSAIIPAIIYCKLLRRRLVFRANQANQLKSKREEFLTKLSLKFADHIVFLTEEYSSEVLAPILDGRIRKKCWVIPNGLDLSYFKPKSREFSSRPRLGMASRLTPNKDLETLISAIKLIPPDEHATLSIAGEGSERTKLERLAETLGVADRVEFLGVLSGDELLAFYQSLDIYVHATFGETMSNSLMQAMAVGLPIVSTDVMGVNNMLVNKHEALLVPVQDAASLCQAIQTLIKSFALRKTLGASGRKKAETNYSVVSQSRAYLKILGMDHSKLD